MKYFRCDVTKEEDWQNLWKQAESKLGYISILVNNAGIIPSPSYKGPTLWKKCLDIMSYGVSIGIFLAIEKMSITKECIPIQIQICNPINVSAILNREDQVEGLLTLVQYLDSQQPPIHMKWVRVMWPPSGELLDIQETLPQLSLTFTTLKVKPTHTFFMILLSC